MDAAQTTNAGTPSPETFSLSAFREGTAEGKDPQAAATAAIGEPAKPAAAGGETAKSGATAAGTTTAAGEPDAAAVAAAEAEANSAKPDADLSEAARKLRGNRKDIRAQKMREDNDELARQLHRRKELRSELERLATAPTTERNTATAGAEPPAGLAGLDPKDPEPTLEQYAAAHPTDPDPFQGWLKDWNRWDRRREGRAAEATRLQDEQRTQIDQVRTQLQERATAARSKYSDYDAVVDALDVALGDHPANALISRFVARSKVGGDLAYRLGKDLEKTIEAVKGGADVLLAHLGVVESQFSAPAPKPGTEAALVTSAPAPHVPVAAAATASTSYDPKKSDSLDDWRANKDRILAGARS